MVRKPDQSTESPATRASEHELGSWPGCGGRDAGKGKKTHTKVRLFLSSPGDVEAERQKVRAVVQQTNLMLGEHLGFFLELLEWKTHVAPDMGDRPQGVINSQIKDHRRQKLPFMRRMRKFYVLYASGAMSLD